MNEYGENISIRFGHCHGYLRVILFFFFLVSYICQFDSNTHTHSAFKFKPWYISMWSIRSNVNLFIQILLKISNKQIDNNNNKKIIKESNNNRSMIGYGSIILRWWWWWSNQDINHNWSKMRKTIQFRYLKRAEIIFIFSHSL